MNTFTLTGVGATNYIAKCPSIVIDYGSATEDKSETSNIGPVYKNLIINEVINTFTSLSESSIFDIVQSFIGSGEIYISVEEMNEDGKLVCTYKWTLSFLSNSKELQEAILVKPVNEPARLNYNKYMTAVKEGSRDTYITNPPFDTTLFEDRIYFIFEETNESLNDPEYIRHIVDSVWSAGNTMYDIYNKICKEPLYKLTDLGNNKCKYELTGDAVYFSGSQPEKPGNVNPPLPLEIYTILELAVSISFLQEDRFDNYRPTTILAENMLRYIDDAAVRELLPKTVKLLTFK